MLNAWWKLIKIFWALAVGQKVYDPSLFVKFFHWGALWNFHRPMWKQELPSRSGQITVWSCWAPCMHAPTGFHSAASRSAFGSYTARPGGVVRSYFTLSKACCCCGPQVHMFDFISSSLRGFVFKAKWVMHFPRWFIILTKRLTSLIFLGFSWFWWRSPCQGLQLKRQVLLDHRWKLDRQR